jgi:hypothetical protein
MSDDTLLVELETLTAEGWAVIRRGSYWAHVVGHGMDKDLYVRTMVELYHYTRHNSINQAFAAWRVPPEDMGLLRFCYHHADEELGHEKMIVHDLASIGVEADLVAHEPAPATQALVGYLYGVGLLHGAVARLGYSYWAETSYEHIGELLGRARSDLHLTDRQMTFFVAHQAVDVKHAKEVKRAISQFARSQGDRRQLKAVARTTLYLTGQILDNVIHAYRAECD